MHRARPGEDCEAQKPDKSISDDTGRSARTCKQRPLRTKTKAKGEPGRKEWTAGWLRGGCTGTRKGRMGRMGEGERARRGHCGVIGTSRGGCVRFLLFCSQESRDSLLPLDTPSPRQSASPGLPSGHSRPPRFPLVLPPPVVAPRLPAPSPSSTLCRRRQVRSPNKFHSERRCTVASNFHTS